MQSAGITGRSGGALGQSSHYTDGDRSVATGSMRAQGGGPSDFDLDREAGRLFAEIIKRRAKDPSAGAPDASGQANYQPFRTSVFHDPAHNTFLQNAHNHSTRDLAKDNEQHWQRSGHSWSRLPRFAPARARGGGGGGGLGGGGLGGGGLGGGVAYPAQERFYNTDAGSKQTLYSGVRSSAWGTSQRATGKKFEEYQRQHRVQTAEHIGPGAYISNEPWQPKEVCGEVPRSAVFCSASQRNLFQAPGFRVIDDRTEYRRRTRRELRERQQQQAGAGAGGGGSLLRGALSPAAEAAALLGGGGGDGRARPRTEFAPPGGDPSAQEFFQLSEEGGSGGGGGGGGGGVPAGTWHGRPTHRRDLEAPSPRSGAGRNMATTMQGAWERTDDGSASFGRTRGIRATQRSNRQISTSGSLVSEGSKAALSFSRAARTTFADQKIQQLQSYNKSYVRVPTQQQLLGQQQNVGHSRTVSGVNMSRQPSIHHESMGSLYVDENGPLMMLRANTAPVHGVYEQVL